MPLHISFKKPRILRFFCTGFFVHLFRELPGRLPKISEFATPPASACVCRKAHVEYLQATRGVCPRVCQGTLNGMSWGEQKHNNCRVNKNPSNSERFKSSNKKNKPVITGPSPKNKHVNYQTLLGWPKTSMEESLGWRLSPMPPSPQWI